MVWFILDPCWLTDHLASLTIGQGQRDQGVVSDSCARDADQSLIKEMKLCIQLMKLTVSTSKVDVMLSKWTVYLGFNYTEECRTFS